MIATLKKKYLNILQKYTYWGKNKQERTRFLNFLDNIEISEEDPFKDLEEKSISIELSIEDYKSRILVDTNEIISPIYLNHNIELPLLELHIDKDNFVVFTTKNIYNCRDTFNSVINYDDIIGIDEISLILSSSNTKIAQIFDILIVLSNGTSMPIKVEHGIPISCIVYFLITITKR